MSRSVRRGVRRFATVAGAVVASGVLVIAAGVAPAGATSQANGTTAYCRTLATYHAVQPKGPVWSVYQKWAKKYLPFFEKLTSEAPNSTVKATLSKLVGIVKFEAASTNGQGLGAYLARHQKQWYDGWTAVEKSLLACGTSS